MKFNFSYRHFCSICPFQGSKSQIEFIVESVKVITGVTSWPLAVVRSDIEQLMHGIMGSPEPYGALMSFPKRVNN